MRKLLLAILIILLTITPALAVDSVDYDYKKNVREGYDTHVWTVSTTDNPGTVGEVAAGKSVNIHGWIIGYKVVPDGSNQPDSSYNIELRDDNDFDYLFDECSALDGTDQTASTNVNTPLTDANAWAFIGGDQLTVYADGMGDCTSTCAFVLYLYIKPNKAR